MTIKESLDKLFSLHNFGIKLGIDNIQKFLDQIGNPQNSYKTIHVAGSNGKGSTSAFAASILKEFGFSVGLYSSPHFVRFNERIKINNIEIEDDYIAGFVNKHNDLIDRLQLTFFEVTTAMAFQYFADKNVDYAVIETGLGGRLDATNVLTPEACIITSIGLEHTHILGDTLEKIAVEKAGIIKLNVPVFCGDMAGEAENVIEKKCNELGCRNYKLKDYILKRDDSIELYTEDIEIDDFTTPLRGNYQKLNAALAGLTISKLFDTDDYAHIEKGIRNVLENTGLQGRYEIFNSKPDIIFDSAHNPDGVKEFIEEFNKDSKGYDKKSLLFGAMKDKSLKEMLTTLGNHFDNIYVTEIDYERSAKAADLKKIAEEIGSGSRN